jgi:hypothetical protein
MKLIKSIVFTAILLAGTAFSAQAITLTGFGDTDFLVTYSDFTTTVPGANSLLVAGSDFGSAVYGTLATPISLSGSSDYLLLTGTYDGFSMGRFQISLADEDGDTLNYEADFTAFTPGQLTTVRLDFASMIGVFNGPVTMLAIIANGSGDNVNLTVDHLTAEAIPEPSTWALLLIATGGTAIYLRRRKVA